MINLTFICAGVLLDDSILAINQTILRERERERESWVCANNVKTFLIKLKGAKKEKMNLM